MEGGLDKSPTAGTDQDQNLEGNKGQTAGQSVHSPRVSPRPSRRTCVTLVKAEGTTMGCCYHTHSSPRTFLRPRDKSKKNTISF